MFLQESDHLNLFTELHSECAAEKEDQDPFLMRCGFSKGAFSMSALNVKTTTQPDIVIKEPPPTPTVLLQWHLWRSGEIWFRGLPGQVEICSSRSCSSVPRVVLGSTWAMCMWLLIMLHTADEFAPTLDSVSFSSGQNRSFWLLAGPYRVSLKINIVRWLTERWIFPHWPFVSSGSIYRGFTLLTAIYAKYSMHAWLLLKSSELIEKSFLINTVWATCPS